MSNYSHLIFKCQKDPGLNSEDIVGYVHGLWDGVRHYESGTLKRRGAFYVIIGSRMGVPCYPKEIKEIAERLFRKDHPPALIQSDWNGIGSSFDWDEVAKTYRKVRKPPLLFDAIRVKLKPNYRDYASLILPELFSVEGDELTWSGEGTIERQLAMEIEECLISNGVISDGIPELGSCLTFGRECGWLLDGQDLMYELRKELAYIHNGVNLLCQGRCVLRFPPQSAKMLATHASEKSWLSEPPLSEAIQIWYDPNRYFSDNNNPR